MIVWSAARVIVAEVLCSPYLYVRSMCSQLPGNSCLLYTSSEELVPPNPNELDKNVSNSVSTLREGIFSRAEASSGSSKLRLGAVSYTHLDVYKRQG